MFVSSGILYKVDVFRVRWEKRSKIHAEDKIRNLSKNYSLSSKNLMLQKIE